MTKKLLNPTPVGRAGSVFLLAQAGDLAGGDLNGPAQTHDLRLDLLSEIKPLQVWFKWGVFEPTDQAEYEQALAQVAEKRYNPDQPRDPAGTSTGGQWSPEGGVGSSPAGSAGLTGPEVRARLEDVKDYKADEVASLREEAKRRAAAVVAEYERQLAAGLTENESAQKAIRHLQYNMSQVQDQIYGIENERANMQRAMLKTETPGTARPEFADAITEKQRETISLGFDWFNGLVGEKSRGVVNVVPNTTGRSSYQATPNKLYGSVLSYAGGGFRTLIHEMGHHFEHTAPGGLEEAVAFYNRRTAGLPGEFLRTLRPDHGYSDQEITIPDNFYDPYVGKVYYGGGSTGMAIRSTEVISMGIEAMWADPAKFANDDPDHFDLIWKLMRS